jgi:hypothetical protein
MIEQGNLLQDPYAHGPLGEVHFKSCELMGEVESNTVQLAVLTPPYTNQRNGKDLDKADYKGFLESVLGEIRRVLKPTGSLVVINTDLRDHARYNGGDKAYDGTIWFRHNFLRESAEVAGFKCVDHKIWVKSEGISPYRYQFAHITFYLKSHCQGFRPGNLAKNPAFRSDVWFLERGTIRVDKGGLIFRDGMHPEIAERCIEELTEPGDLVLSPTVGTGTIPIVAQLMSRRWVGYEMDIGLKSRIDEGVGGYNLPPVYHDILARYTGPQQRGLLTQKEMSSMGPRIIKFNIQADELYHSFRMPFGAQVVRLDCEGEYLVFFVLISLLETRTENRSFRIYTDKDTPPDDEIYAGICQRANGPITVYNLYERRESALS